jgi:hypothetical protein
MTQPDHLVDALTSTIKQTMVHEMEDFSKGLQKAKQQISQTQTSILHTIREKLEHTSLSLDAVPSPDAATAFPSMFPASPASKTPFAAAGVISTGSPAQRKNSTATPSNASPTATQSRKASTASGLGSSSNQPVNPVDAEAILRETECTSVVGLLQALQISEESIFGLYHEIQTRHEEVEKMELENRHLEEQVQEQVCLCARSRCRHVCVSWLMHIALAVDEAPARARRRPRTTQAGAGSQYPGAEGADEQI